MTNEEKKRVIDTARAQFDANGSPVQSELFAEPYSPAPQPPPQSGKESVITWLIDALNQRRIFGLRKYGTELQTHNGRKPFADAMDEILDFVVYTAQGERELFDLRREVEDARADREMLGEVVDLLISDEAAILEGDEEESVTETLKRLLAERQEIFNLVRGFADFDEIGGTVAVIERLIAQRADYDDAGRKHAERAKEVERLTRALKMTEEAGEDIRKKNVALLEAAEESKAEREDAERLAEDLRKQLNSQNAALLMRIKELEAIPRNSELFDDVKKQSAELQSLRAHIVDLRRDLADERDALHVRNGEVEALQKFKSYVHERLDRAGVPTHPEGPHREHGCRVGDRIDWLLARLNDAKNGTGDASNVLVQRLTARNEDLSKRIAELEAQGMERQDELAYQKRIVNEAHTREARAVETMGAEVEGLKEKLSKMSYALTRAQELQAQAERAHAAAVGDTMRTIMAGNAEETFALFRNVKGEKTPIFPVPEGLTIKRLVAEAHANAISKGFYNGVEPTNAEVAQRLALIHSEVSEALEELRVENDATRAMIWRNPEGKPCGFASELADIVIRVGDLCGWLAIDLEHACDAKMEYNRSRPSKHGKRF